MNEQTIFQNISMMVFNAMNRGVDKETAMKEAEETMKALIQKTKEIAASANTEEEN